MFTISHLRQKVDTTFSALGDEARQILHYFVDSIEKDVEEVKAAAAKLMSHGYEVTSSSQVGLVGTGTNAGDVFAVDPVTGTLHRVNDSPVVAGEQRGSSAEQLSEVAKERGTNLQAGLGSDPQPGSAAAEANRIGALTGNMFDPNAVGGFNDVSSGAPIPVDGVSFEMGGQKFVGNDDPPPVEAEDDGRTTGGEQGGLAAGTPTAT